MQLITLISGSFLLIAWFQLVLSTSSNNDANQNDADSANFMQGLVCLQTQNITRNDQFITSKTFDLSQVDDPTVSFEPVEWKANLTVIWCTRDHFESISNRSNNNAPIFFVPAGHEGDADAHASLVKWAFWRNFNEYISTAGNHDSLSKNYHIKRMKGYMPTSEIFNLNPFPNDESFSHEFYGNKQIINSHHHSLVSKPTVEIKNDTDLAQWWHKKWKLISTTDEIKQFKSKYPSFDLKSMFYFKNVDTNQEMVLLADEHDNKKRSEKNIKFLKEFNPSIYITEHEYLLFKWTERAQNNLKSEKSQWDNNYVKKLDEKYPQLKYGITAATLGTASAMYTQSSSSMCTKLCYGYAASCTIHCLWKYATDEQTQRYNQNFHDMTSHINSTLRNSNQDNVWILGDCLSWFELTGWRVVNNFLQNVFYDYGKIKHKTLKQTVKMLLLYQLRKLNQEFVSANDVWEIKQQVDDFDYFKSDCLARSHFMWKGLMAAGSEKYSMHDKVVGWFGAQHVFDILFAIQTNLSFNHFFADQ